MVCEHVAFHQALQKQNPNVTLYIQPKFLNTGQPSYRFMARVLEHWKPIYNVTWNDKYLAKYYAPLLEKNTECG